MYTGIKVHDVPLKGPLVPNAVDGDDCFRAKKLFTL